MSRKAGSDAARMASQGRMASQRQFAIAYLNVVMREADQEELVAALSRIARMCGKSRMVESRLLEKIELNAQALYRALCLRGNPGLRSAVALLQDMGIRLAMEPLPQLPHHANAEDAAADFASRAQRSLERRGRSGALDPP